MKKFYRSALQRFIRFRRRKFELIKAVPYNLLLFTSHRLSFQGIKSLPC
jgi:hypothetical protein